MNNALFTSRAEIRFVRGRLKFGGSRNSAPWYVFLGGGQDD